VNLEAKLSNAPNSLEDGHVGLKFQLNMLEFMDFMNQNLKCGNDDEPTRQNDQAPHIARC